ncbi:hypothetical protein J437_LFUL013862 [Ladona fulva]|uniref:RNA-directed DNA polymerase n=1 Tax=Ladona fulva TaxID=123851 RepID=A0A8K0P6K1_LADFU|nr:hypothetical protein J437_LFUL013862 [Ladona fulva]
MVFEFHLHKPIFFHLQRPKDALLVIKIGKLNKRLKRDFHPRNQGRSSAEDPQRVITKYDFAKVVEVSSSSSRSLSTKLIRYLLISSVSSGIPGIREGTGGSRDALRVRDFPTPRNVRNFREFLRLASYYLRFVRGFATTARPLQYLLKKDSDWEWRSEEEQSFCHLKEALLSVPALQHFEECAIHTHISCESFVAALVHGWKECTVAYISRQLSDCETCYHRDELKCLAVVWAVEKLWHYIYGRPFTVVT